MKQPKSLARRLRHPTFAWHGGPLGYDRPVGTAFVRIQRRVGGHWREVTSDLGLDVLWRVDSSGVYHAEWEPPYNHRLGTYRFRITANRYRLKSKPFHLRPSRELVPHRVSAPAGNVAVVLDYPKPEVREAVGDPPPDKKAGLTNRPTHVGRGGTVTFVVDGHRRTVTAGPDGRFEIRAAPGAGVKIPAGAARDRFGNYNGEASG